MFGFNLIEKEVIGGWHSAVVWEAAATLSPELEGQDRSDTDQKAVQGYTELDLETGVHPPVILLLAEGRGKDALKRQFEEYGCLSVNCQKTAVIWLLADELGFDCTL